MTGLLLLSVLLSGEPGAAEYLRSCCGVTPADMERLNCGETIGRVLKGGQGAEIGIFGAVRLAASKDDFLRWYRNVENFKASALVTKVGRFHHPPRDGDISRFELEPDEVRSLRDCRVGDCGFRLTASEIALIRKDLASPEQANERVRRMLLEFAQRYEERGEAALSPYVDKKRPVDPAAEYEALLRGFPAFAHLPAKEEGFLYWTVERYGFGFKPLLNFMEVAIHRPSPALAVIRSRQIRGSHYYDGSVGFTVLADAPGSGTYLVYLNRSRIDLLRGAFAFWKRAMVERHAPGSIRKELGVIKKAVESAAAAYR